jgi:hypothetical protein
MISFSDIPPATTWKKILQQPGINNDQHGRILRRLLSITSTDPPKIRIDHPAMSTPTHAILVELNQAPPTAYTIYMDGRWDTIDADFTTAFQEQRDPTNRRNSHHPHRPRLDAT